jgi:ribosome-binding protein aMBF1 (putative translation factor)
VNVSQKRKPTSDAVEILHRRYYQGRPERIRELEEERANEEIARMLLELREKAGLTQQDLAKRVGTTPSVISRLEDSEYEGHSLSMLRRIALALNKKVEIRFTTMKDSKLKAA